MSNANLTARKSEHDREIENLWSTDHALHVQLSGSTLLGEGQVAEFTPIIELDSSVGLSLFYRDDVDTTNSGSVTNANGEFNLSTGTTSGSSADLRTSERGRYLPGIMSMAGIAVRRPTAMTGDQEIRWGYFDTVDGMFFGEDSTGIFVRHRHNSIDEDKVYQSSWNVDTLDGSGDQSNPSGLSLDLSTMTAYRMPFLWYGGGPIEMVVEVLDSENRIHNVTVHRFGPPSGAPILSNPKLPIRAEADNGTTTTDVELFVAGRHFAVIGRYKPNRRQAAQEVYSVAVDTTLSPLISFRKKAGRGNETISVKVSGLGMLSDVDGVWQVIVGGNLTGASFGSISNILDSETSLEVDTSATAISNGVAIDKGIAAGGQGNSSNISEIQAIGLNLPDDDIVSLCFRTAAGTGTVTAVFTIAEEW